MMRYRKRPTSPTRPKSPVEVEDGAWRAGPLFVKIAAVCMLGVALVAGLHHLLRYEFLRTGYVFAAAMTAPLLPIAAVLTYVPRRRPRTAFTTQVEIPGTNSIQIVIAIVAYLYCLVAAGTMVYGFITGYPVHAFLWAAGPASIVWLCAHERRLNLFKALRAKQSFVLSPEALTLTASPSQAEVRILWTDNARVGTTGFLGTDIVPEPTTGKPPYTVMFHCPITSLTQLDRLLDHFNTHPADRQLLAQPEGADLVQTLLDTTPQP